MQPKARVDVNVSEILMGPMWWFFRKKTVISLGRFLKLEIN
jgi:hypothetical protein